MRWTRLAKTACSAAIRSGVDSVERIDRGIGLSVPVVLERVDLWWKVTVR
jgi:hypothetical protein